MNIEVLIIVAGLWLIAEIVRLGLRGLFRLDRFLAGNRWEKEQRLARWSI